MKSFKSILVFFLMFSASFVFSQQWRDSLTAARNSYKKQEYGKAFKTYQSAQKLAPEGIDLSEEMGQSAYKSQQYKEAEEIYKQNSAKQSTSSKKASEYHNLGNSRMKSKDYQGAVDAYKEALRNNPKDNDTRYNLSEAMRQLNDQQQKQNKKNDQQDQNKQNQNQQNQNQNNQNQNQQNQGNKPKNQNGKPSDGEGKTKDGPKLKDKAVEKKLDELMKQEANTKRRLNGNSSEGGSSKSGKDW